MVRRRHLSRIAVMQTLFEREKRPESDPLVILERNIKELSGLGQLDEEFTTTLLVGILEHEKDILDTIQRHAPQWEPERMDPISHALLLIGGYELLLCPDVPRAVVMDEAIEIAKEFGTEQSSKFVNGVLNAIGKTKETDS